MPQIQADLIYLSASPDLDCERQFSELREVYPEIKRVHGSFDTARALSLCSKIADGEEFTIITPDYDLSTNSQLKPVILGLEHYGQIGTYHKNDITNSDSVLSPPRDSGNLDIVYLTYEEEIADQNFSNMKQKYPHAMRLHRVRGLTKAFRLSAELASTKWYILVDGDNEVLSEFNLAAVSPPEQENQVKIFFTRNPVNGLVYGYGGIKVCPKTYFQKITNDSIDPIASGQLQPVFDNNRTVASVIRFNTSVFNAWKAGFRESAMLTAQIDKALSVKSDWASEKLRIWKTVGADQPFGSWAIAGAHDGESFAKEARDADKDEIIRQRMEVINDPVWLKNRFDHLHPQTAPGLT